MKAEFQDSCTCLHPGNPVGFLHLPRFLAWSAADTAHAQEIFGWPVWLDRCLHSYSAQSLFSFMAPKWVSISMVVTDGGLSSSEAMEPIVSWCHSSFSVSFLWPFHGAPTPFPSLFSPSLGSVMWVRMFLFWLSSPETGLMAPKRCTGWWRTRVPAREDSGTTLFKNGCSEGNAVSA